MPARVHGRITQWFDDRGYGFITAAGGSKQIFLHVSEFGARGARPKVGDAVTFFPQRDDRGRLRAIAVEFAERARVEAPSRGARWWIPVIVIGSVAALALDGRVPWWLVGLYAAASGDAWLLYAWDKSRAAVRARRVPENTLHLVALVGGWPGALVAQQQFRHKTRKTSFRVAFWLTVALNVAALATFVVEGRLPF